MATTNGTFLLTGANGGLGKAIVEQHADAKFPSCHAIFTVRDANRAPDLASDSAHEIVSLDLTDLDNVRRVAEDINARVSAGKIPPIRALVLNAGFQDFGKQSWTSQGLDTTFAANYLGHWLLTLLLLQSMDKVAGRIVVLGSQAHDPHDPRNASGRAFADPKYQTIVTDAARVRAIATGAWSPATEDAGFRGGYRRYGAAKLCLIMLQHELQARLLDAEAGSGEIGHSNSNLCVVGVDPGAMSTGMQRLAPWVIRVLFFRVLFPLVAYVAPKRAFLVPTGRAAGRVLEAALGTGEGGTALLKDKYFHEGVPMETSEESRDAGKRKVVWEESVKLAGLEEGETILRNWK
ncbi:short-chain dehydrogenase [Apiospora marii]|uniref:Short-chain dehydrogenase n=1 Tax=Apiospora marii TaxID=335849 RepID=A0ABR1R197_9PEZI